jgi:hypothetical protein
MSRRRVKKIIYVQEGDGMISDLVDKILPTRKDFPPKVRKAVKDYGDKEITSITVGRTPVQSMVQKAFDFITGGKFKEGIKKMNYDDVYHLFMLVGLEGGTTLLVEKNSVINMKPVSPSYGGTDKMTVAVNKKITFGEMIEKAVKAVGPSLYLYDVVNNNCQKFITDLLKHSGLLTPALNTYINQDIEKVLSNSPSYAKKVADFATEASAKLDRLVEVQEEKRKL